MIKILLLSNSQKMFDITNKVIANRYNLVWYTHDFILDNDYPFADIVIMHFEQKLMMGGMLNSIIRVKGALGHAVPILAVVEGGGPQDIFSILSTGAYDYLKVIEVPIKYEQKIEDIVRWHWYIKKYGPAMG